MVRFLFESARGVSAWPPFRSRPTVPASSAPAISGMTFLMSASQPPPAQTAAVVGPAEREAAMGREQGPEEGGQISGAHVALPWVERRSGMRRTTLLFRPCRGEHRIRPVGFYHCGCMVGAG